MIRMIQRRLIIPRGDTGSFTVPCLKKVNTGDIAVFTIFNTKTKTRIFQKITKVEGDNLVIAFSHKETVNLKPGKYLWDIKIYSEPLFLDDELVDWQEVNSYYAGFSLPECEIKETGDTLLVADSPSSTSTPTPSQLDSITNALDIITANIARIEDNVSHYPKIIDGYWYIWDSTQNEYVNSNISIEGINSEDYVHVSDLNSLSQEDLDAIFSGNGGN